MSGNFVTEPQATDKPQSNRAYWIQGCVAEAWQNLEHFSSSQQALDHIGKYVSDKSFDELRLVSATFSPITEKIKYRHLATIADGAVIRPDNEEIVSPPKSQPLDIKYENIIQSTTDTPYGFGKDFHPPFQEKDENRDFDIKNLPVLYVDSDETTKRRWPFMAATVIIFFVALTAAAYLIYPEKSLNLTSQVATYVIEKIKGERLISAIDADDQAMVAKQLIKGVDPNSTDVLGVPALVLAVDAGNEKIVKKLLAGGADPDARTKDGLPLLLHYVKNDNAEMVAQFISYGADLNAAHPSTACETALFIAKKNSYNNIETLLVENGATQNLGSGCTVETQEIDMLPASNLEGSPIPTTVISSTQPAPPLLSEVPIPMPPPKLSEPLLAAVPIPVAIPQVTEEKVALSPPVDTAENTTARNIEELSGTDPKRQKMNNDPFEGILYSLKKAFGFSN